MLIIFLGLVFESNALGLTLEECFESAKKTNPRFEILKISKKEQKLYKTKSFLDILPQVDLSRKLNDDPQPLRTKIASKKPNAIIARGNISLAQISSIGSHSYRANVEQNIALSEEQKLLMEGIKCYLSFCEEKHKLALSSSTLEFAKSGNKLATAKFQMGSATKIDVLNSEAELAKAAFDKDSQENALTIAKRTFTQFFGITPDGEIETPSNQREMALSRDELLQFTLANNPNLKAKQNSASMQKAMLAQSAAERLPQIEYSFRTTLDNANPDETVQWALSIPILAGQQSSILDIPLKKHALRKAMIAKMHYQDELEANVLANWQNQEQQKAQLRMLEKYIEAKNLRLTAITQECALGKGTLIDLYKAAQELDIAKLQQVKAQYGLIISKYEILALCGNLSKELFPNTKDSKKIKKIQS